jgi:ATP phosphoribosyltransferase
VQIAREHFAAKGVHINLIKLYGSMELAPLTDLAETIVDVVSSCNTLKANDLVAVEHICDISSRLVMNRAAAKLKRSLLEPILAAFSGAIAVEGAPDVTAQPSGNLAPVK